MSNPSGYSLQYRRGTEPWKEFPLTSEVIIGRSQGCNLLLDSKNISHQHTRLNITPEGVWLTDLGSSNGTNLENRKIPPQVSQPIHPGESFSLGEFTFILKYSSPVQTVVDQSPATPSWILRFRQGQGEWKDYPLKTETIIGRNTDCDLVVTDEKTSRRHAQVSLKPDGIWLTDLGSSNGTKINNVRIAPNIPLLIQPGQVFTIGGLNYMVMSVGQAAQAGENAFPAVTLWYRYGDGQWKEYQVTHDLFIGRSSSNDLIIDDPKVSRHHALMSLRPDGIWLVDQGSQNGIKLNNQQIPSKGSQQLLPGQVFQMGSTSFTLTSPGAPPPGQAPSQPPAVIQAPLPPPAIPAPPRQPVYPQPPPPGIPPRPVYYPAYPIPPYREPPKKKGGAGWLFALLGGLLIVICLCGPVTGIGLFYFLFAPAPTPVVIVDEEGTRIALQDTTAAEQPNQETETFTPQEPSLESNQGITPTPQSPKPGKPTSTPSPSPTKEPAKTGQTWLVMVYQDGDDPILEHDVFYDFNEMEKVGSTDQVQIVSQFDRYKGEFTGDGDWTTTKRFYITKDDDLNHIHSKELADIGEAKMSDPNTLVDFVLWAMKNYPADKYVLILSDHGSGWPGALSDEDPKSDGMTLPQLDQALQYITQQTGIGQFELVGFDACLMSQIEALTMLAPYARYAVTSEETEPALGWAYAGFLSELVQNPDMTGKELAEAVVNSYIVKDERIVDDKARADFLAEKQVEGNYTADQVAQAMLKDVTMAGIDLSSIDAVNAALNEFSKSLTNIKPSNLAEARTYAQTYENVFGDEFPAPYIDLANFAELVVSSSSDSQVKQAEEKLVAAIKAAVIAEKHGSKRPGSNGISIYYPNSKLYKDTYDDTYNLSYTSNANRFADLSLWDDFLAFHYLGHPIKQ